MTKPNSLVINKLLSIITEGEGKREGEGLLNCCRWKSLGRHGPGGGGGAWSRWWFPGAAVKAGWMVRFLGTAMKSGQTARFLGTAMKSGQTARFLGMAVKVGWTAQLPGTLTLRRNEVHVEGMEEGTQWRQTRRRSGRRWVCGKEMTRLWFRGSNTLKKKDSSDNMVEQIDPFND
jgi:hypothetical protein